MKYIKKKLINKSKYKINHCSGRVMFIHVVWLWMCVLFYFSLVCLHVCAYAFKFKVHCGSSFEPGASRLPYYFTPPVCVPAVIGGPGAAEQQKKSSNSNVILVVIQTWFRSNSNMILTRQTCGHRSSRVAGSKHRALAFYFSVRILRKPGSAWPNRTALPQWTSDTWMLFWSRHSHTQIYKQTMNRTKHTWKTKDYFEV